jgi:pimeloyl-ACP methyl ester carboxylesterase
LLVFAEMRRTLDYAATERRTLVLSDILNPVRYELEITTGGARSAWLAERRGEVMDILNGNLDWFAPVTIEGLSPAPQVMLDSSPSALPFALLLLRLSEQELQGSGKPTTLQALDVMEDFPLSRPLSTTVNTARQGAVLGTVAVEGKVEGSRNPQFTMWVRTGNRALYSVEMSDYRFGLWEQAAHRTLRQRGKLVIQRVSKLPEAPPVARGSATRKALEFTGADATRRAGTLILPAGSGPFPCLVLHSGAGLAPRWDPGDVFAARGWAVYAYDKRGVGESKGEYDRGPLTALAADAAAAATMLAQQPELDGKRLAFLGVGEAGYVGAVALGSGAGYAGAILASCATTGPLFPALAQQRVRQVMAPFYGWDAARTTAYEKLSTERWQQLLFAKQNELTFLRRRSSLTALKDWAAADMAAALGTTKKPLLLLHGEADLWTPLAGARALQERLQDAGGRVTLRAFPGLGADLGQGSAGGLFAPTVDEAIWAWLNELGKG